MAGLPRRAACSGSSRHESGHRLGFLAGKRAPFVEPVLVDRRVDVPSGIVVSVGIGDTAHPCQQVGDRTRGVEAGIAYRERVGERGEVEGRVEVGPDIRESYRAAAADA